MPLKPIRIASLIMTFAGALSATPGAWAGAANGPIPAPAKDEALLAKPVKETAVFAGGCFWGTQSVFERVKGVVDTTAGYAGGSAATATYAQVTQENTNHAESVQVIYDASRISYGRLLQVFFAVAHDPTQRNRQGPDIGSSYRSAIFYADPKQKTLSENYIAQLNSAKVFAKPIATEVVPLNGFYKAEDYHQDYALHNPDNPYIEVCDRPKIAALQKQFPDLFQTYTGK